MNKYGQAAVQAVEFIHNQSYKQPRDAWDAATSQIFGQGSSSQEKSCPKNAFLGLCEDGLVKGIAPGNYTRSKKNKKYATNAIRVLQKQPSLVDEPNSLWKIVTDGDSILHNQQMNVVIALWRNGFIK